MTSTSGTFQLACQIPFVNHEHIDTSTCELRKKLSATEPRSRELLVAP